MSNLDASERPELAYTYHAHDPQWANHSINPPVTLQPEPQSQSSSSRVCDRCMQKKVKCNLQRPACSRCIEEDARCIYSSTRRKPGPAKGSRQKRSIITASRSFHATPPEPRLSAGVTSRAQQSLTSIEDLFPQHIFADSTASFPPITETSSHAGEISTSLGQGSIPQSPIDPQLHPDQERQLLEGFFAYIHPSIPLLRKRSFLDRYEHGFINRSLLLTILGVSAKIQGLTSVWANPSLDSCLGSLLASTKITDKEIPDSSISLDDFQQACLLVFYEFHQYPGQQSWARIGQLTRKAYQCGLHQLDNRYQCPLFDTHPMSNDEIEEWRTLWWCIYCLDSYCNITAATPFVVELDSVKTRLRQNAESADSQFVSEAAIFLPAETEQLWKTSKEITSRAGDFTFNIHIVTTTIIREAARLCRLWKQNPSERLRSRFDALEQDLSAVRLSLPAHYFNLARNALLNESSSAHHGRLISILHLHASRVLLSYPLNLQENESEWLTRWRRTLEGCEDIVLVIREWNPQQCLSVDPAVCLIASEALMILHLHSQDMANSDPELQTRLRTHKDLLLLFLEQFATIWDLPRFLITSVKRLSERLSGPLTSTDIDQILRRMQGALHPSWIRFLSLTSETPTSAVQLDFDPISFPAADFADWESWGDLSSMGSISQGF